MKISTYVVVETNEIDFSESSRKAFTDIKDAAEAVAARFRQLAKQYSAANPRITIIGNNHGFSVDTMENFIASHPRTIYHLTTHEGCVHMEIYEQELCIGTEAKMAIGKDYDDGYIIEDLQSRFDDVYEGPPISEEDKEKFFSAHGNDLVDEFRHTLDHSDGYWDYYWFAIESALKSVMNKNINNG